MSALSEGALATHRREIHVHCYRLLANFDEAEDAVQEAFVKAWQARDRFVGDNQRAWLYRIATNVCLDRMRQAKATDKPFVEVEWLQPYPDVLLEEVVVARETIELAFLTVMQLLPARQRAVLILRDVLEWSAQETADALEMTVPAVTSALQRARATIASRCDEERPVRELSPHEQRVLDEFIDAHEQMDLDRSLAAVREDIRISMPPNHGMYFIGKDHMREFFGIAQTMGEWKLVATWANHMPCAASYIKKPGDTIFRAMKLDVLRVEGDLITEATTFDASRFVSFGLPEVVDA